jgi:hypothetical protein
MNTNRQIRRPTSEHDEVAEGPGAHLQGLRQHHQRARSGAAEAAALRAAAERMDDLSRGAPLAAAITARAAAIRLDHWADELTDEAREDVP